jgi:hypothetical protein
MTNTIIPQAFKLKAALSAIPHSQAIGLDIESKQQVSREVPLPALLQHSFPAGHWLAAARKDRL